MFSCDFCKTLEDSFSTENLWRADIKHTNITDEIGCKLVGFILIHWIHVQQMTKIYFYKILSYTSYVSDNMVFHCEDRNIVLIMLFCKWKTAVLDIFCLLRTYFLAIFFLTHFLKPIDLTSFINGKLLKRIWSG